jgi:hypothetical protein
VSPWTQNLHTWSPTPQSGRFGSCAVLEARPGSCELTLFCSHFDGTLSPTLAHLFVDVAQVLQGFQRRIPGATHDQCGSVTERPQASSRYPWGSPPAVVRGPEREGPDREPTRARCRRGDVGGGGGGRRRSQEHVGTGLEGRAGGVRGGRGHHHRVGLRRLRRCPGRNLTPPLSLSGRAMDGGGRRVEPRNNQPS